MSTVITRDQATEYVGKNLKRILATRGISQAELARQSGIPEMTISQVVNWKNEPGIGVVARIAEALDVTIDVLLRQPS
jgi:transcriptional regulator with XRE-family HTH domain